MVRLIQELSQVMTVADACRALDFPRSSFYRLSAERSGTIRQAQGEQNAANALSEVERLQIRAVLNSERFQDCSPYTIYATLLDEGEYLCSVSTMYRILREHAEVQERRDQRRHPTYTKPELLATKPNQLWSWDISWLRGPVPGLYYYLYVILDVFSRYVVGWTIVETESADQAQALIAFACHNQGIAQEQLTLHSAPRGYPGPAMMSIPVAHLLEQLGVAKSHSRPYTSNDNPYSEAQFKTMKYRPDYPERFGSIEEARQWGRTFFHWYNFEHYHSGIGLLPPAALHFGSAQSMVDARQAVLDEAYQRHPERFVNGPPVAPAPPTAVWINPPLPERNTLSSLIPEPEPLRREGSLD